MVGGGQQRIIKQNTKFYYNAGFGNPKVRAHDSKMGPEPPVEKH